VQRRAVQANGQETCCWRDWLQGHWGPERDLLLHVIGFPHKPQKPSDKKGTPREGHVCTGFEAPPFLKVVDGSLAQHEARGFRPATRAGNRSASLDVGAARHLDIVQEGGGETLGQYCALWSFVWWERDTGKGEIE